MVSTAAPPHAFHRSLDAAIGVKTMPLPLAAIMKRKINGEHVK
jgi:hypothetical protein